MCGCSFFSAAELQDVMDGIDTKVDRLAKRLLAAGEITDGHAELGFTKRLAAIEQDWPGAAVLIHQERDLDEATRALWSHPRLLALTSSIIGPELAGNPVWNLRSKTPAMALTTVPWHQDIAYLCPGAESTPQPTAWIPLLDVSEHNGTLKFIKGGHRSTNGDEQTIMRKSTSSPFSLLF